MLGRRRHRAAHQIHRVDSSGGDRSVVWVLAAVDWVRLLLLLLLLLQLLLWQYTGVCGLCGLCGVCGVCGVYGVALL